jgi:hypothetical protein
MHSDCTLRFFPVEPNAFSGALAECDSSRPIILIGQGELAEAIARLASAALLSRFAELPGPLPAQCILVLTETDAEHLAAQLIACVDYADITILAPVTSHHASRKPLFIVSIPKGGTHLVYELAAAMGYAAGVELPDFPKPQTWYCLEYSNSHTVAKDFFVDTVRRSPFGNRHHPFPHSPVLFCYRHPLDILVSEAHYYCRDGKTAFSGYFAGEDLDQRIRRLTHDEWLLGSLRQRVGGFLPWLRFPNVIPVSFEELVGEKGGGIEALQRRLIWSILLKLQVDGSVADIAGRVFNTHSATFHEGRIGAFRTQLSASLIEDLARDCQELMEGFGYDIQSAPPISHHAEQFLRRPLRYSAENFDSMAIGVESGVLGCNLVRFGGRFYAAPLSAGPLDFNTLTQEQRSRLPSTESLSDLKTLLTIGRRSYATHRRQLDATGAALLGREELPEETYWNDDPHPPRILGEYGDYNLILWQQRHLAIRRSIGAVDLQTNTEIATLRAAHGDRDILVAPDQDVLIQSIDNVLATSRLDTGIAAVRTLLGGLEADTRKLEQDWRIVQETHAESLHRAQQNIATLAKEERNARVELGLQLRLHGQQIAEQAQARLDESQQATRRVLLERMAATEANLAERYRTGQVELQQQISNALEEQKNETHTAIAALAQKHADTATEIDRLHTAADTVRAELTQQLGQLHAENLGLKEALQTVQTAQTAFAALAQQHETANAAMLRQIQELRHTNESLHTRIGALEGNRVIVTANRLSRLYRRIFRK